MPSDNPPAFPLTTGQFVHERGMSLRDWFAGQALPMIRGSSSPEEAAFFAYQMADALLAARKETPDE